METKKETRERERHITADHKEETAGHLSTAVCTI